MHQFSFTHTVSYNDPWLKGKDVKPIIPIAIKINGIEVALPMLIDSGSYWTGLPIECADIFEIDLTAIPSEKGEGAGGEFNFKVIPLAELTIFEDGDDKIEIKCPIAFNDGIKGWPYGILGREGFFENFLVGFKHRDMNCIYFCKEED